MVSPVIVLSFRRLKTAIPRLEKMSYLALLSKIREVATSPESRRDEKG
jgi:hypothetical protein